MGSMVMLSGALGPGVFRRTSSIPLAVLVGLESAPVGTVMTRQFGLATDLAFLPHLETAGSADSPGGNGSAIHINRRQLIGDGPVPWSAELPSVGGIRRRGTRPETRA